MVATGYFRRPTNNSTTKKPNNNNNKTRKYITLTITNKKQPILTISNNIVPILYKKFGQGAKSNNYFQNIMENRFLI